LPSGAAEDSVLVDSDAVLVGYRIPVFWGNIRIKLLIATVFYPRKMESQAKWNFHSENIIDTKNQIMCL